MTVQLCDVCASIPEYFWMKIYDIIENCRVPSAKLQTLSHMRVAAAKGCQLCTTLLKSYNLYQVDEENEILYLQRSWSRPECAVFLMMQSEEVCISEAYFYRIPWWWWDLSVPASIWDHRPQYTVHKPIHQTDPVDNTQLMKVWTRICQSHNECSKNAALFLPTRLLDVQAFSTDADIRLVSSGPIIESINAERAPHPHYLTLSHCWGPPEKHSIKTTKQNLAGNMSRIRIASLSKTFEVAVHITRELGFRYLWIDSLCIVQNDRKDWAKEAALMTDVYGNSYCTLAALSSKDGTEGCNLVPNIKETMACSFFDMSTTRDNSSYIRIFEREPLDWITEYGEEKEPSIPIVNPLRFRAWTLQEDELSSRIIFFAKGQLLWRCREQKATAQLPWLEKRSSDTTLDSPWPICDGVEHHDYIQQKKYKGDKDQWYQLIEDYSLRSLTVDTDKLSALAGIARKYQAVYPSAPYVAGMWGLQIPFTPGVTFPSEPVTKPDTSIFSSHLCATLLWRSVDEYASRYPEYVAPTWSWASVKGRISYDSQRIAPGDLNNRGHLTTNNLWNCDFGSIQWEQMHASPDGQDKYGAIKSGASLELSGALLVHCHGVKPVDAPAPYVTGDYIRTYTRPIDDLAAHIKLPLLPPHMDTNEKEEGELLLRYGKVIGVFYRDTQTNDDALQAGRTYCLRVRGESFFSLVRHKIKLENDMAMEDTAMCLVLVKNPEGFRRIGMARWVNESMFANIRPRSVKLV